MSIQEEKNTPVIRENDLSRWAPENPRALINLISPAWRADLIEGYAKPHNKRYFHMTEGNLKSQLRKEEMPLDDTDYILRRKFWSEYDRVMVSNEPKIIEINIFANVVNPVVWQSYKKLIIKNAWLFCPPTAYDDKQNAYLEYSLEQLGDILQRPHVINGRVDSRLASLKFSIHKYLDERVRGATIQRVDTRNLSVTEHKLIIKESLEDDQASLERRLKYLAKEEAKALHAPNAGAIEVKALGPSTMVPVTASEGPLFGRIESAVAVEKENANKYYEETEDELIEEPSTKEIKVKRVGRPPKANADGIKRDDKGNPSV